MQFDGYVPTDSAVIIFEYCDGELTLFAPNGSEAAKANEALQNCQDILAFRLNGTTLLFHLALPLDMPLFMPFSRFRCEVEWYIEDYYKDIAYHSMNLSFAELDYFFPSAGMTEFKNMSISLQTTPRVSPVGKIKIMGEECEINLVNTHSETFSVSASIHTSSLISVHFSPTDDIDFLLAVYHIIHRAFSFICNRKNIYPEIKLLGEIISQDGSIIKKNSPTFSILHINCLSKWGEKESILRKTPYFSIYKEHLGAFFQLFADDYMDCSSEAKNEAKGYVSIESLHESSLHRHHIDLSQYLHITAAFEFYVRKYLPPIGDNLNEDEKELLNILQDFIKNHTGKVKKTAKYLQRSLQNRISLSEKIQNAYNGYKNDQGLEWKPLKGILGKIYGSDISFLAEDINELRNDFAHEKRTYIPSEKTVRSIRMLELINYCIVLRKVGYSDEQISAILKATFPDETKRYEVDG